MYPQEDGSVIGFSWLLSIADHNGLRVPAAAGPSNAPASPLANHCEYVISPVRSTPSACAISLSRVRLAEP
jgi:hypothetical protein